MAEATQGRALNTAYQSGRVTEEAAPKVRVSLDISPELYAKLQEMAKDLRGLRATSSESRLP